MAGDAAGLIALLAGDGIAVALRSGVLAAEQAAGFLSGELNAREFTVRYAALWRQAFGSRMRWGRTLQRILLQPRSASFAIRLLIALPGLGRLLIARTRD